MATTIKLKNSVTTTNAPSSLVQGEVAINITDKKVWVGNAATTPIQLLGGGADGNFTNISVSSVATFGAGTVSAPSITTTGDTNTGIFFPAADTIAFTEGGAEAMRINSSGQVGIGTSSPAHRLEVVAAQGTVVVSSSTGTNFSYLASANTGGTFLLGMDSSAGTLSGVAYANILWTNNTYPMVFSTNTAERMRITSGGDLLVGTTSTSIVSGWTAKGIAMSGDLTGGAMTINSSSSTGTQYFIGFGRGGSLCGSIQSTGTNATSYSTSSDYRLKENIAPMTGALAKIAQLKPVTYTWKSDGTKSQGFIAHELQAVMPDCVIGEKDAVDEDGNIKPQGVDTSFLVATLTSAIQELNAKVEAQAAEIALLKSK
jgi:hypothetical protein